MTDHHCRRCVTPLTDANWYPSMRTRGRRLCKTCYKGICRASQKKHRAKNRAKRTAYAREWREKNREHYRAYQRDYYQKRSEWVDVNK